MQKTGLELARIIALVAEIKVKGVVIISPTLNPPDDADNEVLNRTSRDNSNAMWPLQNNLKFSTHRYFLNFS